MSLSASINAREATQLIDHYGKQGRAFLFLISYDQTENHVLPLDTIDPRELQFDFGTIGNNLSPAQLSPPPIVPLCDWEWSVRPPSPETYSRAFRTVRQHLLHGDSFLCNLTQPLEVHTNLTLSDIFHHSRAPYRLWWNKHFCCFSPEPFVSISDGTIRSHPMKGTLPASLPDAQQRLLSDPKEAAEHATIVDLIRNDLSIIAHDVRVSRYRYLEHIHTHRGDILQTSSEITARLPENYRSQLGTLLFKLLPAGSITGAPKLRTQDIIAQAEGYNRGFYTGVMGIFDGQKLESAVMIRFVEESTAGNKIFKAGGGITTLSNEESEYQEILHKAYVPLSRNPLSS